VGDLIMFEEIQELHSDHADNLREIFHKSNKLNLCPAHLNYRKLSKQDFDNIFAVVDEMQPRLNYDHISGACLYVHTQLKDALAKKGYHSELIFGDVYVNNIAHIDCTTGLLEKQLDDGVSYTEQKIHCWLLLENYQFFDATLFRDLTNGKYAAEIYGFGENVIEGDLFKYKAMLAGKRFIEKTNPIPQL
jgi:hypothetical protein